MNHIIEQLERNKAVFHDLLKHENKTVILWKQSPDKWNLLEIVCHLFDEERNDFRFRVQWVLEKPGQTPPPIDPIAWMTENNYSGQDYDNKLEAFINERKTSISWLRSLNLGHVNWDNSYEHSKLGVLTARFFLENWLAHDYLHIRQILKLKFDFLNSHPGTDLKYAGNW